MRQAVAVLTLLKGRLGKYGGPVRDEGMAVPCLELSDRQQSEPTGAQTEQRRRAAPRSPAQHRQSCAHLRGGQ